MGGRGLPAALLAGALFLVGCRVAASKQGPTQSGSPTTTSVGGQAVRTGARIPNLASIHMTNAADGWGMSAAMYRTADGGCTWKKVLQPPAAPVDGMGLTAAYYGAEDAWVVSAVRGALTVYRTTDGGTTWAQTSITASGIVGIPVLLDFADAEHGWLWAQWIGGGAGYSPGALYVTEDGGSHWTSVATVSPGAASGTFPQGRKTGMALSATGEGWLAGADPAAGGPGFLVAGVDGGQTWTAEHPPIQVTESPVMLLSPVVLGAGTLGLFVQRTGVATAAGVSPPGFQMDTSMDDGETWRPGEAVAVPAAPQTDVVWSFPDATHGIATNGTTVYVTADAGATWTSFSPNRSLQGVAQLDFLSPRVGFAILAYHEHVLLRTKDGAHTWTPVACCERCMDG